MNVIIATHRSRFCVRPLLGVLDNVTDGNGPLADGHLPANAASGAENVTGGLITDYGFFRVEGSNSPVTDTIARRQIEMEPGSIWLIGSSPQEYRNQLKFGNGLTSAWFPSLVGWQQIQQDYKQFTSDLGAPRVLELSDENRLSWTDPVTGQRVSGRVATPDKADPGAPTILVLDARTTIHEPVHGDVDVVAGDALVLRVPLELQDRIAQAHTRGAAVLLDPQGNVQPLSSAKVSIQPHFWSSEAKSLDPQARSALQPALSDKALVKTLADGSVEGQLLPGSGLLNWIFERQSGLGYVSISRTAPDAEPPLRQPVPLNGLIAIGDGAGELPYDYVLDNAEVEVQEDGNPAFFFAIRKQRVGQITFGRAAADRANLMAVRKAGELEQEATSLAPYAHEDTLISPVMSWSYSDSGRVLELRRRNLRTNRQTIERWKNQTLLSRTWLAADGATPLRTTYYAGRSDRQIPTHTTTGIDGPIEERYVTSATDGVLMIATWSGDGRSRLKLTEQDEVRAATSYARGTPAIIRWKSASLTLAFERITTSPSTTRASMTG